MAFTDIVPANGGTTFRCVLTISFSSKIPLISLSTKSSNFTELTATLSVTSAAKCSDRFSTTTAPDDAGAETEIIGASTSAATCTTIGVGVLTTLASPV